MNQNKKINLILLLSYFFLIQICLVNSSPPPQLSQDSINSLLENENIKNLDPPNLEDEVINELKKTPEEIQAEKELELLETKKKEQELKYLNEINNLKKENINVAIVSLSILLIILLIIGIGFKYYI